MGLLVGKVSLAWSYLWDKVTAVQLGDTGGAWSLPTATGTSCCYIKKEAQPVPVSLASRWQGVEV